ncbi:hypothetical protein ACSVHC_05210 [Arthrobacter sp. KNU-44]|uniref:hypothetical protein n=1 Tax=unclassified Arthrobacter TaxID=235627 RepID=UPI003F434AEA
MVTSDPDRRLLAGPTAFALLRMRFRCSTVALVFLAIILFLSVSAVLPQSWFTNTLVLAMGVSALSVGILIPYVAIKAEGEGEAGYTTLQHGNRKLEQRDPYLGRVIRGPGEDYLQRADFLEMVQSAKAEAEESAQKSRTSRR